MDETNGTSEAPFSTVEEPRWLNEGTHTPIWEVIEDLARRCSGDALIVELLLKAAELAKAKGTL